jgi:hypothetical protein
LTTSSLLSVLALSSLEPRLDALIAPVLVMSFI